MNIGLVTDCYHPTKNGVVTAVALLKNGLEQRGHRVVVLTAAYPGASPPEPGIYRFRSVSFNRSIELRIALPDFRAVYQVIERERLDVIHTHTEFTLAWAARAAARRLDIPLIHSTHTLWQDYRHYLYFGSLITPGMIRRWFTRFLRPYQMLIYPSYKMQRCFAPLALTASAAIIPNGACAHQFNPARLADSDLAAARQRLGLTAADRVLLAVGRLGQEKRVIELLAVLIPLLRDRRECKLLLIGDGPAARSLRRMTAQHGIGDRVLLPGYIPWDQMPNIYGIAHVYVTASLSEVHPITLIEAAMMGLPIITRQDDAFVGLVSDDQNGYQVETDEQIAIRAAELLDDESRRAAFARRSREIAPFFGAENHVRLVEGLYRMQGQIRARQRAKQHPEG